MRSEMGNKIIKNLDSTHPEKNLFEIQIIGQTGAQLGCFKGRGCVVEMGHIDIGKAICACTILDCNWNGEFINTKNSLQLSLDNLIDWPDESRANNSPPCRKGQGL